jgi:hypothetical protein
MWTARMMVSARLEIYNFNNIVPVGMFCLGLCPTVLDKYILSQNF